MIEKHKILKEIFDIIWYDYSNLYYSDKNGFMMYNWWPIVDIYSFLLTEKFIFLLENYLIDRWFILKEQSMFITIFKWWFCLDFIKNLLDLHNKKL